ncbi:MAG: peptide chain release factor N(5)-glutamine methyltransferase [Odoribacter sp.]
MNTIRQLSQYALQELKDSYPEYEIQCLCSIIYMDVLHFTNIDIHIRKNEILDESFINKFNEIILLLKSGHPIQYIIGETEFSGLKLNLNQSTLIPRPETEELVVWVKEAINSGQKILDIGTGSGCIAIALAKHCPEAQIVGIDISGEAIRVARQNAEKNQVGVQFMVRDILREECYHWGSYDIIVSNPPYVKESEKKGMESRVLDYEPHQALFVPDTDPLLFYRQVATFGQMRLKAGGLLFFEINEAMGKEMLALLENSGYREIELRKDIFGKDRMIKCKRV